MSMRPLWPRDTAERRKWVQCVYVGGDGKTEYAEFKQNDKNPFRIFLAVISGSRHVYILIFAELMVWFIFVFFLAEFFLRIFTKLLSDICVHSVNGWTHRIKMWSINHSKYAFSSRSENLPSQPTFQFNEPRFPSSLLAWGTNTFKPITLVFHCILMQPHDSVCVLTATEWIMMHQRLA